MDLSIIRERLGQVETFKQENKIARNALSSELENDTEYLKVCEEIKALLEKKKRIKEAIWSKPETQKLVLDIKENREELNVLEEVLSVELMEYYEVKKVDEIEDSTGELRKFKFVAKILPKKDKNDERDNEGKYAAKIDPDMIAGTKQNNETA